MSTRARRVMHDEEGLNSGVWPIQTDHFVTPVDRFFTRSHAAVPRVDPATWRLEVGGLVERPRTFSFEELRRGFAQQHVTATLVCAGLRREEFLSLGPLPGETPWGPEAASTGRWTGPSLRDVLHAAGVREGARHVEFIGLDQVDRQGRRFGFGGSIDLAKAMSGEVTLASELNGAPLPAAHGFPLRAVVPGWIGARSVKWLGRITLLEEPSPNYFQRSAYRIQRAINPQDPRDVTSGTALSGVPLNAVIGDPLPDQVIRAGRVQVRGWAMGSMGRRVSSVELSPNGGRDWIAARLSAESEDWTWNFWEATVELAPGRHTLVVRATDSTGTTQPEAVAAAWNVKGYCNNGWHRVAIQVE
ncbi:MAG TPA: sulfite oxidase [Gemmatimonadales bacterium]